MPLRKNQRKRLRQAQAKAKKSGGQVIWRDGKPLVQGGKKPKTPKRSIDPQGYLPVGRINLKEALQVVGYDVEPVSNPEQNKEEGEPENVDHSDNV